MKHKRPRAAGPSTSETRNKQYSFEDVARLICKGRDPTECLAGHFRIWAWPMEVFPNVKQKPPLKRKPMIDALTALASAADVILGSLHDSRQMDFVMASKHGPFDRVALIQQLWDLKRRCGDSLVLPMLASADGAAKPGPGFASPERNNLRVYCASVILLAWRTLHGSYPGSRNPWAREAAEALFRLASAPAGRPDLQPEGSKAKDPLSAWRRPFEVARANEPILGQSREFYLSHLRLALARDELSKGQDRPGPPGEGGPNSSI
jgi:hypothetical protein